jgi:hypothetical protein
VNPNKDTIDKDGQLRQEINIDDVMDIFSGNKNSKEQIRDNGIGEEQRSLMMMMEGKNRYEQ